MDHPAWRFGEFVLDRATRELRRGGKRVSLSAKAFDCIAYLIEQRGRAVGRDELIAAVWGRVDVSDSVLSQTVLYARRALEDTGREQHAIRTVVGFGYHWVAPIETVELRARPTAANSPTGSGSASGSGANPESGTAAEDPPPVRGTRFPHSRAMPGRRIAVGLLLATAFLLAAGWWFRRDVPPRVPSSDLAARSDAGALLVLPLEVSGGHAAAWMRLGVMDLIAERLRETGAAVVPSERAVQLAQAFDTRDAGDLEALASASSAAMILAPRAEWADGRWHVRLATAGTRADRAVAGTSDDLLDAARDAADAIARRVGLQAPASLRGSAADRPLRQLMQEIEAATLADRLDEARALIERATPARRREPEMRYRLARIDLQAGRLDAAQAALERLADEVGAERDAELRGRILVALGSIATRRGQSDAGEADLDEAIRLLQRAGATQRLGKAHAERAAARIALHDDIGALEDFAAARVALEGSGDRVSLAYLDSNLGAFAMLRDRFREAEASFRSAARRFSALRIPSAELNAWDAMAQAQLVLFEPAAAARSAAHLGPLLERVENPDHRRAANLTRIEVLVANGSLRAARDLFDAARAADPETPDTITRGRFDAIDARMALVQGDVPRAARSAQAAFEAITRGDDQRLRMRNWLVLVRARLAGGQFDEAAASLARIRKQAGNDRPAATLYATLAEAEWAAHADPEHARAAFDRALAIADAHRVPLDLVEVVDSYSRWLLAQNDPRAATAVVERIAAWAPHDFRAAVPQLRLYHAIGQRAAWQAALSRTRGLAGERRIPADLLALP
jgi:DNA-binding winged helix-turn-helix (wHTH) protein/tetratricopeptide (TPR) repeat protein